MLSRLLRHHLFRKRRAKARQAKLRSRPVLESLESRTVLYATTGNLWPNPGLITISIMPDGTNLGGPTSNLNASFNSKPALNQPGNTWQTILLKAAQTWAAATNINFALVPDNGAPSGSAGDQQGDPGYGDIRIGGYNFGTATLARAFQPPPVNNYSIAGDIAFNTGQSFNVNTTYDLYTVAVHEIGHALGLDHSSASSQTQMYPTYNGVKNSLNSDDVAGIRNIYSGNAARDLDQSAMAGYTNNTFATASNLGGFLNTSTLTAAVTDLDLYFLGDNEYFSATVPSGTTGTMAVNVQSAGISLLSPKVTVYAADMKTVLGTANGLGKFGTTVGLNVPNLLAGQKVFVMVQGADTSVFSTGSYDLGVSFGANAAPTFGSTARPIAAGATLSSGGGIADVKNTQEDHYSDQVPVIVGVDIDTGASSNDGVTSDTTPAAKGSASYGDTVTIYRNGVVVGTEVADKNNSWVLTKGNTRLADGFYAFTASATDSTGHVSPMSDPFYVRVDTVAPNAPTIDVISPDNGFSNTDAVTNAKNPTFSGTAEPGSTVTLINASNNGDAKSGTALGLTVADGYGRWQYTVPGGGLSEGTLSYYATATDVAGNVSRLSSTFTTVIDLTAPIQPTVLSISPDTGLVTTDGATNQPKLIFGGTSEPGDWVYVSVDGPQVGMALADIRTGAWSYDNTANPLSDGTHAVTVTTMDMAGNLSQSSKAFTVTVDTIATDAPVIVSMTPDTGRSATDWVTTNTQKPTLAGTTIGNGIVRVYSNGVSVGQTTAGGNGQWSFIDPSNYKDGTYAYTATVTDYVGNVSKLSNAQTMVVDTTAPSAPAITGFSPDSGVVGDGITAAKAPTLFGTAEPGSAVSILQSGKSGSIGSALADAAGNWSFTYPGSGLSDGSYKFTAQATDAAGNTGQTSQQFSLAIDTTAPSAPVVTGTSPDTGLITTDGATNQPRLIFNGTAEARSVVAVAINGNVIGTTTADKNGVWSFDNTSVGLPDGMYNVTATATDAAGNTGQSSKSYAVTLNTVPSAAPAFTTIGTFWGPAGDGGLTNAKKPTFSGSTINGGIVNLYWGPTLLGTTTASLDHGAWSLTSSLSLADGAYTVTATTTDYVGNVSTASSPFHFNLDATAPDKPVILAISPDAGVSNTDGITSVKTPTFSGTAESGSTVKLFTDKDTYGTTVADAGGNWSIAVTKGISDGSYDVKATATDHAGNTSGNASNFKLVIDTRISDPRFTKISPDTGAKNDDEITSTGNITLSGTSDPNDSITVFQDGVAVGTTTANNSGVWTYDHSAVTLPDGTYAFTFVSGDAAGNVTSHPASISVTVDTVAYTPVISGVLKTVDGSNTPILAISGTAEARGQVKVMAGTSVIGTANADDKGNWTFNYAYNKSATTYTFAGVTTDLAGNVSPASSAFKLLLKNSPTASGLKVDSGSILGTDGSGTPQTTSTPTITGKATVGSLVTILDGNSVLGTAVADIKGNWAFVSPALSKGKHDLTAMASDATGAYGLLSDAFTISV